MAFLDESGLAELWSLVRNADVKMVSGTYTGNGNSGSSNKSSLTFPFEPKLIVFLNPGLIQVFGYETIRYENVVLSKELLTQSSTYSIGVWYTDTYDYTQRSTSLYFTLSGNTLTWYLNSNYGGGYQMNESGKKYCYIAFG